MKKMMKEQFLRFLQKTRTKLRKNKFTRLEQTKKKKRRNQKGEEKLKGFHRKR